MDHETTAAHERRGLRYPSDLTDAEWTLVEPFMPPAKRGGRRRTVDVREVLNGILYVLATGCESLSENRWCKYIMNEQQALRQ